MTQPVTIADIQVFTTQPHAYARLVIVKVITSEPGLYGLGCASYTTRPDAVVTALEKHIKPFLLGRDVARIEEIWQMNMVHGYWRNGPILNNAISGIDQALWDIKGKRANMPVYDLLGGACRPAAQVYTHAGGNTPEAVVEHVQRCQAEGYRYIRVQLGFYGGIVQNIVKPDNAQPGGYFDRRTYTRTTLGMMEHVRAAVGDEVELLHDIHERLHPSEAVEFAKDLEQFKLYFLEDPLAPEDLEWFARIRSQCATPIAMGELFNHPREWQPLIVGKYIDFIRMHVSQMGGITPARAVVALANAYGVRTAWHGPADVSPVGHAANLHLDLWAPNFGVQEWCRFPEHVYEMFPGLPEVRNGYMYPNDKPGLGIEFDEKLAAKFPCKPEFEVWPQPRLPDGTPVRP